MSLAARGRRLAVIGLLLAGGIGVVSSTQTWLRVIRADAGEPVLVSGASAVPLLAPLSLAVLALGAVLTLVGPVLRRVLAVLAGACAVILSIATVPLVVAPPTAAVAPSVTAVTGVAGDAAMHELIGAIEPTPWVPVALACWLLLLAAAVFTLATAGRWKAAGRRYRTEAAVLSPDRDDQGPLDHVETWDGLSRGSDPTR
ncbi:MAG: Trp biosynthesis-associated membrane protein [Microbacterium sp.]